MANLKIQGKPNWSVTFPSKRMRENGASKFHVVIEAETEEAVLEAWQEIIEQMGWSNGKS